jgi:bifunctional enzyme Fae/Hps
MILSRKKKYLQVALNSTMSEAYSVISRLPASDRIIVEAGTPLIKAYGTGAISDIRSWWGSRLAGSGYLPYVVADLKTMDRADTEVTLAKSAGASAAICLGQAPVETVSRFIETCKTLGLDSMVDMMNIDNPVGILRKLRKLPDVVLLHRGVDEEAYNRDKPIPYIQINKIRGSYDVAISIAGGDTPREVQRAVFNDADIVVVWKEFYKATGDTADLAREFLQEIK